MSSEKNLIHANVDALVAALSKKCGQSGYEQFTSITVNEDYTAFTIVVNDVKMTDEEKQAVTDLFLMAGLQAVQTEQAVRNIQVERVNMLGGVISREETNP
jgi:formiminotetrahydrofolate cyclodeaminase